MIDAKRRLIFLELNEINFDIVNQYLADDLSSYPSLRRLCNNARIHTFAEQEYCELEPWIQWTSIHTGKSYFEHKIYRLGDIVKSELPQFFEILEKSGFSVGAISPMNAENRLRNPAYYIPDPWTKTPSDESWWSNKLSSAIAQVVNDNSQSRFTIKSAFYIMLGLIRFAKFKHYFLYLKLIFSSFTAPWRKALVLDLFLHDLHTSLFKDKLPHFSVIFLNAGAHIQHHYMLNSGFISSNYSLKNPEWYVSPKLDPFSEMLEVYDQIIEEYLDNNSCELIVATGLSQRPYDRIKYYYRLKNHSTFLTKLGINFVEIYPRMTRDFLVSFASTKDAKNAQYILSKLRISGKSEPLFGEIDNRGNELFISLTYPDEIVMSDVVIFDSIILDIYKEVAFVAIKNGMHQSKGFAFFSSGVAKLAPKNGSHVKELHSTVLDFFSA